MKTICDTEKMKRILHDLSVLTGISISFINTDYQMICNSVKNYDFCSELQKEKKYKNRCQDCDTDILQKCIKSGSVESHICHAGLYDIAMPILKGEIIAGYILIGRIRCDKSPKEAMHGLCGKLSDLYSETPYFTDEQIKSLTTLLPDIFFEGAIKIELTGIAEEIGEYIDRNTAGELSVDTLCRNFHISKNYLYKAFRDSYDCTVNEYITEKRINKAKELLSETNMPIYEIAEKVGFDNYTYFCKLFKSKTGICASMMRKNTTS